MSKKTLNQIRYTLLSILMLCGLRSTAQQQIEIVLCDDMVNESHESITIFRLVYQGDTVSFPSIGRNKYLNPLGLIGTPSTSSMNDTVKVKVLIENCRYQYLVEMYMRDLNCSNLEFCIEDKEYSTGAYKWSYLNCSSIWVAGIVHRKRK